MKIINFAEWWTENRNNVNLILWILPKKLRTWVGVVISYIDFTLSNSPDVASSSFNREVLPCIRVNADGSTTLINCKTGAEIPKKA